MACSLTSQINSSLPKPSLTRRFNQYKSSLSSMVQPLLKELNGLGMKVEVAKTRVLDELVYSLFQFVDQPLPPLQSNLAPVDEIGEPVEVACIHGEIPTDFPQGVYIRNGPNPIFGGKKSTTSIFGKTNQVWVEGEGMLHAIYFLKNHNQDATDGFDSQNWTITYKNKYVESDTFKIETQRNRPTILFNIEGDSLAILASIAFNMLRYGVYAKHYQNISIFEHSGKLYTGSEDFLPQEIDMYNLHTLRTWDINGAWYGPFSGHPKIAPVSGELVTMGISAKLPYCVIGVVSADGKKLMHKVDLKFQRSSYMHDIGVTMNYNVLIDHPLIVDEKRLFKGGPLIKFERDAYSRIGVMPRYGDADSIKWFEVEPNCTLHLVNCFEDNDEVVVRASSAYTSIIPGPDLGKNKSEWFSKGFDFSWSAKVGVNGSLEAGYLLHRIHEWRLNMVTSDVQDKHLTRPDISMDFPMINERFIGLKNRYAYTQVIDSTASSIASFGKYGGLAKLYFDEECQQYKSEDNFEKPIKIKYHKFPENVFCTGATFVAKQNSTEEDDGWVIAYVHDEVKNVSQVYIVDAKMFESEPTAIIDLPQRVPYGHHGIFVSTSNQA